jgi:hypothetical protein
MAAEVLSIPRRPRAEFDEMAAGPELTAALDEVDMAGLVGQDVASGARAAARAKNHADWVRLSYLHEMCRARAGTLTRAEQPDAAVAAAAFGWSMAMATAQLTLAAGVLERLPELGDAVHDGWLEERKATVFVTVLADLDDTQATTVVADVLPEAPALPVQQLIERVTRAAIAADPLWAARRHAAARKRARLRTSLGPAATMNLSACDVDPEMAQDAYLHVQTLARVIRGRLRALGHRIPLGYIATHTLLRLAGGTLSGADDDTILAAITAELAEDSDAPADDSANPGPDDGGSDDSGPNDSGPNDSGPDDSGPDDSGPDDSGPDDDPADEGPDDGPNDEGPTDEGPDDGGPSDDDPTDDGPDDGGPSHEDPTGSGPTDSGPGNASPDDADPDRPDDAVHEPAAGEPAGEPGPDRSAADPSSPAGTGAGAEGSEAARVPLLAGVVVRLPLTTLLGLDDRPGELPGLGPVPGRVAAGIAARRVGARTRLLLHDPSGALEHLLDLGPPPAATTNRRRRQIVEITAETEFFDGLDPADFDAGRAVVIRRARAALEVQRDHPERHPAVSLADRDRRLPGPALAAWVRARDQHCPFRACTRRAHDNDLDHTRAWTEYGRTVATNLSPPCRAHHTRKHRDWRLRQPRPGHFVITDPTGTEHHTVSRVIDPLPDPCPATEEEPERLPPEALLPLPDEQPNPWRARRGRNGRITPEARQAAVHLTDRARRHRGDPPTRYDAAPDF